MKEKQEMVGLDCFGVKHCQQYSMATRDGSDAMGKFPQRLRKVFTFTLININLDWTIRGIKSFLFPACYKIPHIPRSLPSIVLRLYTESTQR